MPFQDLTDDPVWKFSCYSVDYDILLSKHGNEELIAGFEVIKEVVKEIIKSKIKIPGV